MTPYQRFLALLERLGVQSGDVLYVHTSYSRVAHLGIMVPEVIDGLLETVGANGTVVMPSFAWNLDKSQRPWKGYSDYFHTCPSFDVIRTPANIGVVPERFRHHPNAKRSLSYWWSVCAVGKHASEVTEGQQRVEEPYGPHSSFGLLRRLQAKIVGLGVSTNTNSLALTADHELGFRHPHQIFTGEPRPGVVIDASRRRLETASFWLLPEVVRAIKPSAVIGASPALTSAMKRADQEDDIYFSYVHDLYHAEALRLAEVAITRTERVPWLVDYPRRDELAAASREAAGSL